MLIIGLPITYQLPTLPKANTVIHAPNVSTLKMITVATPTSTGIVIDRGTTMRNGADRSLRGNRCMSTKVRHAEFAGPTTRIDTTVRTTRAMDTCSSRFANNNARNPRDHAISRGHPNCHKRRMRPGSGCSIRNCKGVTTPHSVHGAPSATRSRLWPHSAQCMVFRLARALSSDV